MINYLYDPVEWGLLEWCVWFRVGNRSVLSDVPTGSDPRFTGIHRARIVNSTVQFGLKIAIWPYVEWMRAKGCVEIRKVPFSFSVNETFAVSRFTGGNCERGQALNISRCSAENISFPSLDGHSSLPLVLKMEWVPNLNYRSLNEESSDSVAILASNNDRLSSTVTIERISPTINIGERGTESVVPVENGKRRYVFVNLLAITLITLLCQ